MVWPDWVPEGIDPLEQVSARVGEICRVAREMLGERTWGEVTMRELAARLEIRAPSLYKHVADKDTLRGLLVGVALLDIGIALRDEDGAAPPVATLLKRYRTRALAEPELYRLATMGALPRHLLPPGLEDWSGQPFATAAGDAYRAQALWASAHGLALLEIEGRLPQGEAPQETWDALAAAFG